MRVIEARWGRLHNLSMAVVAIGLAGIVVVNLVRGRQGAPAGTARKSGLNSAGSSPFLPFFFGLPGSPTTVTPSGIGPWPAGRSER